MGDTPFSAVERATSNFLVTICRLLTADPNLDVVVTVVPYKDPTDQSVEHRFMLQVPGQYRGLLIGKRGATADAVRTMARTFVRSKSCFADIDVRVKRDV